MATVKVNAVDRSASYTPEELGAISIRLTAQDGEVGQGTAPIPDPAGTQVPYAGYSFQFKVGATFILDGFVGPLQRERGVSAAGARVLDTYTIGDENAVLHGFRAYRWVRGAESTQTRFLAFLAAFVPWVTDTTWVTSAVTATMAAKTYTTETLFDELFTEIKDLTGNTAFVENHRAHLHPPTNGIIGGLAFSDATWDYSATLPILAAPVPRRSKDPIDLRDDVMVTTPGGNATATDATAIARYDAGGLKHQALVQLGSGTAAAAATKAAAILADSKAERIMYEFDTGPMTAAQLASIPVGCLVSVTSAVLGLSSSTQRIAAMTVTYKIGDLFFAHLECGFPVRIRKAAPRIVAPIDESLAQAQIVAVGSPIAVGSGFTQWQREDYEGIIGTWLSGTQAYGVKCELKNNQSWPGTACGVGLGAQFGHVDGLDAWTYTAPADSGQLFGQLSLAAVSWGTAHLDGLVAGTVPIQTGLLIYPFVGATPPAAVLKGGSVRTDGAGNGILLPRSMFTFGASNGLAVGPAQHVNTDYACITDILNTGINDTGVYVTPVLQFMGLVDGTFGWITAPPLEGFDGLRTVFTLIGGYKTVDAVTLNGVYLPSDAWSATDGSTLTTLGWAPIATDMFLAHYYIPQ
ncbi:MAG TPA: hypothetical protein VIM25_01305 [Candidatus Limnocylindrales bacterium]